MDCKITIDDKIIIIEIWNFNPEIIIIRNPQSEFLSRYNFKNVFQDKKIISFVGGGVRVVNKENNLIPFSEFNINNNDEYIFLFFKNQYFETSTEYVKRLC